MGLAVPGIRDVAAVGAVLTANPVTDGGAQFRPYDGGRGTLGSMFYAYVDASFVVLGIGLLIVPGLWKLAGRGVSSVSKPLRCALYEERAKALCRVHDQVERSVAGGGSMRMPPNNAFVSDACVAALHRRAFSSAAQRER